jgi:hypothetical protein
LSKTVGRLVLVTRFVGALPHLDAAGVDDLIRVDERAGADEVQVEDIDLLNTPVMDVAKKATSAGARKISQQPAASNSSFGVSNGPASPSAGLMPKRGNGDHASL